MPIYEYRCLDCGRISEIYTPSHHVKADPVCANCHSKDLKKIISAPAAVRTVTSSGKGLTCCGSSERCESPPCSSDKTCRRD